MGERPDYVRTSTLHSAPWGGAAPGAVGRGEPVAEYRRYPVERETGDLWTTMTRNPVPVALAAISLGWLWSNRASGSPRSHRASAAGSGRDRGGMATDRSAGAATGGAAVHAQQIGEQVVGQAQQMGGQVQEVAGQVAGQVQTVASQVQDQVQTVAGQVQDQMQERAGQVQQQAQGVWQMVEANPAVIGALGAVVGGVAALLLPETEKENKLLGETRNRVLDSVQQVAEETATKVQRAVAEAGSAAMEAGQSAMDELSSQPQGSTDTGKSGTGKRGSGSETST